MGKKKRTLPDRKIVPRGVGGYSAKRRPVWFFDIAVEKANDHIRAETVRASKTKMGRRPLRSLLIFVIAGLCEISGGYLIWIWLRGGRTVWTAIVGASLLIMYGVVPTFQKAEFGRVYAAYGGVFVVLSVLWGWWIDGIRPDRFDALGSLIVLIGVALIFYAPRG